MGQQYLIDCLRNSKGNDKIIPLFTNICTHPSEIQRQWADSNHFVQGTLQGECLVFLTSTKVHTHGEFQGPVHLPGLGQS